MFWKRCKISTAHFKPATRGKTKTSSNFSLLRKRILGRNTPAQPSHPPEAGLPAGNYPGFRYASRSFFSFFFFLTSLIASSCKVSGCWRQAFNLCIARAVCGECPFALTSSGNKWLLSLDPGSHVLLAYAMQKNPKNTHKKSAGY